MLEVGQLMRGLAQERPVFHSEADFQHAFAWLLHTRYPDANVRPEVPVRLKRGVLNLDIVVHVLNQSYAFELKYKTRGAEFDVRGERFVLMNQAAQPPTRYDVCKDVARLESVATSPLGFRGFAVLLTNDSAYWKEPRSANDTSAAFSLHDGRTLSGELAWSGTAAPGTIRNREQPITLGGRYTLQWRDYSKIPSPSYRDFRYVLFEIASISVNADDGRRTNRSS